MANIFDDPSLDSYNTSAAQTQNIPARPNIFDDPHLDDIHTGTPSDTSGLGSIAKQAIGFAASAGYPLTTAKGRAEVAEALPIGVAHAAWNTAEGMAQLGGKAANAIGRQLGTDKLNNELDNQVSQEHAQTEQAFANKYASNPLAGAAEDVGEGIGQGTQLGVVGVGGKAGYLNQAARATGFGASQEAEDNQGRALNAAGAGLGAVVGKATSDIADHFTNTDVYQKAKSLVDDYLANRGITKNSVGVSLAKSDGLNTPMTPLDALVSVDRHGDIVGGRDIAQLANIAANKTDSAYGNSQLLSLAKDRDADAPDRIVGHFQNHISNVPYYDTLKDLKLQQRQSGDLYKQVLSDEKTPIDSPAIREALTSPEGQKALKAAHTLALNTLDENTGKRAYNIFAETPEQRQQENLSKLGLSPLNPATQVSTRDLLTHEPPIVGQQVVSPNSIIPESVRNQALSDLPIRIKQQTQEAFNVPKSIEGDIDPSKTPLNIRGIDAVKKQLDETRRNAYASGDTTTAQSLQGQFNLLTKAADEVHPEYAKARQSFADPERQKELTKLGSNFNNHAPEEIQQLIKGDKNSEFPFTSDDLANSVSRRDVNLPEKEAYLNGVSNKIQNDVYANAKQPTNVWDIPTQQRLKALLPTEEYAQLSHKMDNENTIEGVNSFIKSGGSRVAGVNKDINESLESPIAKIASNAAKYSAHAKIAAARLLGGTLANAHTAKLEKLKPEEAKHIDAILSDKTHPYWSEPSVPHITIRPRIAPIAAATAGSSAGDINDQR